MNQRNRIGISTYSFWHFKGERIEISSCIERAAEMGFDGVEILHQQMSSEDNAYLHSLKQRAFRLGLDLMGFSTHQGFVSPDTQTRQKNIDHTVRCIEIAYAMGIPTVRINTGRWGTSGSFDELMANRGMEEALPGHNEEEAFGWVIDSIEKCVVHAEKCGVVLGLENHWGLGRTAQGVQRIVRAIDSPWLGVTLDTGNFLDDMYPQMETLAPDAILVQAKTYPGGGEWYELDIDYTRVAQILRAAKYRGYISLEMEGREAAMSAVPKSLEVLRAAFG